MVRLFPSLMAADLLNLQHEIQKLESVSDGFHLDIMDNHFVPNITFGSDMVQAIATATSKQLWLHLMIENPLEFIKKCTAPHGSLISFHIESKTKINELLTLIKEKKFKASIAIKPKTNVNDLYPYLDIIDQVLVMSVEPGYSGQPFLESTLQIVGQLVAHRTAHALSFRIGMDGGINETNITKITHAGVDDCEIGSALFNSKHIDETMRQLRELATR
jgi:ribulose-phosphate 3-epimerase